MPLSRRAYRLDSAHLLVFRATHHVRDYVRVVGRLAVATISICGGYFTTLLLFCEWTWPSKFLSQVAFLFALIFAGYFCWNREVG